MEKLICYQIENTREIERLSSNMKLRIVYADASVYDETLDSIASGNLGDRKTAVTSSVSSQLDTTKDSMLIFCDLSEKHLNRMLFELRSRKVQIDFKAILTSTNRKWTLRQLHAELEREKASFTRQ